MAETVYVVIVNWNGWLDTIECLESVFRNDYPSFRVIVCDNGSSNDSVARIKDWACGHIDILVPSEHPLRPLVVPPILKPLAYVEHDAAVLEASGYESADDAPLIVIRTGRNLGFAGGYNVGLRYAAARPDCEYVWLLNNDTVIVPGALAALVERMRERPDAGQCGSRLLFYHAPDTVQALGGAVYNRWLASTRHIGAFSRGDHPVDVERIERAMDYVVGASLFVRRAFLMDVGLLNEAYFLYHEEIDWATRAGKRYALAYAHDSIVYHKEGGSSGSNSQPDRKSRLADYYGVRSRLLYTYTYYPLALPTVCMTLVVAIFNRLRRGQPERALDILRILLSRTTYMPRSLSGSGLAL